MPSNTANRTALHLWASVELCEAIDAIAERTGLPKVRIVESLLRDTLHMEPIHPGAARTARAAHRMGD